MRDYAKWWINLYPSTIEPCWICSTETRDQNRNKGKYSVGRNDAEFVFQQIGMSKCIYFVRMSTSTYFVEDKIT